MVKGQGETLNFNNTEKAFLHKSNDELKRSGWLFSLMQYPLLVKLGTVITPWAIRSGLPIKNIIRNTLFRQFVGGESLKQTALVTNQLASHGVDVILDYGVEGGEQDENHADKTMHEFIKVIQYAATQSNIPFISIKITGLTSFELLEKLDITIQSSSTYANTIPNITKCIEHLSTPDQLKWQNLKKRFDRICQVAKETGIGIMVDAEESWIQDPIDYLTEEAMSTYNKNICLVYNTVQLYRHDRYDYLEGLLNRSKQNNFIAGVKLVRGAYMEKERKRAEKMGYPSPIQPDKSKCDSDYNRAIDLCFDHIQTTEMIVASHNEKSNMHAALRAQNLEESFKKRVHFSQLYGMSDHLTFNLAGSGYSASKYLPFGPIEEVVPYLMRRAQENSSVSGQTNREYQLLQSEIRRRKN